METQNQKPIIVNIHNPSHWFQNCLAVFGVICIFIFLCILGSCFLIGSTISSAETAFSGLSTGSSAPVKYVSGNPDAEQYIAVIDITGVITSESVSFNDICSKDEIIKQIRDINNDDKAAAIILNLDTPGGEVTAADEIYHELTLVKKPIVSMMNATAASGGYYIAAASQKIVANKLTTTGSIGVVMHTYNVEGLMDFLDIESISYASGKMKTMLDPTLPVNKDADAIVNQIIQNSYKEFVNIVAKSRNIPAETIMNGPIGDGRIMDGPQALSYGLVDKLGYFADAVEEAANLAGLKGNEYYVGKAKSSNDFSKLLMSILGKANISPLNSLLPQNSQRQLKQGRLYYLPAVF